MYEIFTWHLFYAISAVIHPLLEEGQLLTDIHWNIILRICVETKSLTECGIFLRSSNFFIDSIETH